MASISAELLSPTTSNKFYWTYSPLKYWPNDFTSSDVDDKGATGSNTYGGNVSFFAYAPYVVVEKEAGELSDGLSGFVSPKAKGNEDSNKGIIGVTKNSTPGDPKIAYKIGSNVDLLWGTLDKAKMTTPGAGEQENSGVQGKRRATDDGSVTETNLSKYEEAIVENKWVAADLTKQKIGDQVKFNFIHALAAVGGGKDATPDEGAYNSGFQVKLDIDLYAAGEDPKPGAPSGALTGGERETFEDGKYYRTIVTITSVKIANSTMGGEEDGNGNDPKVGELHDSGILNLATGKWDFVGNPSGVSILDQNIGTLLGEGDGVKSVKLNPAIAENYSADENDTWLNRIKETPKSVKDYFSKDAAYLTQLHPGVTTEAQDVYADPDIAPLFLIPGDKPVFEITVEYVVRQYDEALQNQYTEVKNKITKKVAFLESVKMNKHYTLIMHLGLTSVKFTAKVSDWQKAGGTPEGDTGGDTSNESGEIEFELPSNVK